MRLDALRRRPIADWLLLTEAFAALLAARLRLRLLSFAAIDRRLRRPLTRAAAPRPDAIGRVAWAIGAWARHGPIRFRCFAQAIAAQEMLRRRGLPVAIHYGVSRAGDGAVATHAWAMSGARPIVGARQAADFTLLHIFAADARAA